MMLMIPSTSIRWSSFAESECAAGAPEKEFRRELGVASDAAEIADSSASRVDLHSHYISLHQFETLFFTFYYVGSDLINNVVFCRNCVGKTSDGCKLLHV